MKKILRFYLIALAILSICVLGACGSKSFETDDESRSSSSKSEQAYGSESFEIEGKWKNVGDTVFGQAQEGSIITFDGKTCNYFSPQDTYALEKVDDDDYILNCTSYLFSKNLEFDVHVVDNDNIEITRHGNTVELKRIS